MTREEQIMNDPNLSAYTDKQREWINEAFMDGVRWADETMIEKAYEWLLDNSRNYFEASGLHTWINYGKLADDFKKAMEGEQI